MTRWVDAPELDISPLINLNLPRLVAQTLVRRGLSSPASVQAFLNPTDLPITPFPGIDKGVELLRTVIARRDPICVWGDFDVDGQTATTLLVQTLQVLGANVTYYIPIRGREGHGLHVETLKPILDGGAKLVLTCDTGVTANEAVDYARSRGVDVLITDHHDPGDVLPSASMVMNPKLLTADHPLANLAGVGVAYKLAEALLTPNHQPDLENLLDLVALGLIADMALLKGETRSLVQKGIHALRSTTRLGLNMIAEIADTNISSITEETIGFAFGPRLNALGRLSDANPAVELLVTSDPARARVLATQIEGLNTQRRLLTEQVYRAAEDQLNKEPALLRQPIILLYHPAWPGGVLGIVAGQLVERYQKPAILMNLSDQGVLRGSARSVEGLHITAALRKCKDQLISFGGHPIAAGLSLEIDKLPGFRKSLYQFAEAQLGEAGTQEPIVEIDAWLDLSALSLDLANSLEVLAPFGAGNPNLTLATHQLKVESATPMGRTREHRKLVISDQNQIRQEVIWWDGEREELPQGLFDLAYRLRPSTYRGEKRLSLEFQAFRSIEEKPIETFQLKFVTADLRKRPDAFDEASKNGLVWAEGSDQFKGKSRRELEQAEEFIIWTSPPSPAELRTAIEVVKPRKVYVFGVNPLRQTADEFLSRLAGLAKFAIRQRSGMVTLSELAAATAQREITVRLGLAWLTAGGHLSIIDKEDQLILSPGGITADRYLMQELFISVKGLIDEADAYRAHFVTAPVETTLEF